MRDDQGIYHRNGTPLLLERNQGGRGGPCAFLAVDEDGHGDVGDQHEEEVGQLRIACKGGERAALHVDIFWILRASSTSRSWR